MNDINKLYIESSRIIQEMDLPHEHIANLAKIRQEYTNGFPKVVSLPSGVDEVGEIMNDILKQLPMDSILEAQKTIQTNLKPLLGLAESIPFEQIPVIVEVLKEINLNQKSDEDINWTEEKSEETLKEIKIKIEEVIKVTGSNIKEMWRGILLILSENLPKRIFLGVMMMIFMPPYNYIMEKPQTYIHEKWEDLTGVDMTGEVTLMIREEVYLRSESSEYASVVLETALKEAQSVLRLERDGDWVRISVLIDGETHTGWVEKSKLTNSK